MRFRYSRFIAIATLLVLAAIPLSAQAPLPIPITGNLGSISGNPQGYSAVLLQLNNCPTPASITGYMGIVATQYQLQANSAGVINATIWPNDLITCNGTTGASSYSLLFVVNGVPSGTAQCYQVVSTQGVWSLNGSQTPISCAGTPPNPADGNFRNLTVYGYFQAGNGAFSGNLTVGGTLTVTGMSYLNGGLTLGTAPGSCPTGYWISALSATLHPTCTTLGTGVASWNGRFGTVMPLSGDYSYSMITGTPTLYYQTVQSNTTPLTQGSALNFSPPLSAATSAGVTTVTPATTGPGLLFAVANAAGGSGNCTQWTSTGLLGDAGLPCSGTYSPGTNGYQEFPGGLIFQWGTIPSMDSAVWPQPFPLTFPNHIYNMVASTLCTGDRITYVRSFSTASFVLGNNGSGCAATWIAIGD